MFITFCFAAILIFPLPANAQQALPGTSPGFFSPGSELDSYLRYLQTAGLTRTTALGIREPSLYKWRERIPAGPNPWAPRTAEDSFARSTFGFRILPARVGTLFNSGFPFGGNDGAVWAGKGMTGFAQAGAILRAGPLVIQIEPIAFAAQNAPFPLQGNAETGLGKYRTGQIRYTNAIDLPQRFGPGRYSRLDAGESEIRLETPWIMAGISNAHRVIGPATIYPFILGTNASGFPHAFISTQRPVNIGLGKVHANIFWGELAQSPYSPVQGSSTFFSLLEPGKRRFASSLTLVLEPAGVPGLELGASRFFESFWPRTGIPRSYLTKTFGNFLKKDLRERSAREASDLEGSDNQLISVFARWVFPNSGFEVYSEYGREDHAYDFRDLISEPEHSRTYMLGGRYVLSSIDSSLSALRAEIMNYEEPPIVRYRAEGGVYIHSVLHQGHTNRGQMLGAPLGPGASAGSTLAYDRFTPGGQITIAWTRMVIKEAGQFWLTGVQSPSAMDVVHAVSAARTTFRGPLEMSAGLSAAREFNRNFAADAFNLSLYASTTFHFR